MTDARSSSTGGRAGAPLSWYHDIIELVVIGDAHAVAPLLDRDELTEQTGGFSESSLELVLAGLDVMLGRECPRGRPRPR
jgi:hypothetical protein